MVQQVHQGANGVQGSMFAQEHDNGKQILDADQILSQNI